MEFQYTKNPQAEIPVMLLNKRIGRDADGVAGIMGDQVYQEIFALRNMGKKEIEVWINTPGGSWHEGTQIYDALRSSGMKVSTFNKGVVDSTGGWIFQAGDVRNWTNYGLGLVHEIQGSASDATREAVNQSIATMFSSRTGKPVDEVRAIMSSGEVLDATKAIAYGFADNLINCSDITSLMNSSDLDEVYKFGETQIKKALPKSSNMNTVKEILGLSNEATEAAMNEAITKLVNENKANATSLAAVKETLATTTQELTTANAKITELENSSKTAAAEALVKEHVGVRIANTSEVIEQWTNMAKLDLAGTKKLLEGLPVNRTAPKVPTGGPAERSADAPVISAGQYMTYGKK